MILTKNSNVKYQQNKPGSLRRKQLKGQPYQIQDAKYPQLNNEQSLYKLNQDTYLKILEVQRKATVQSLKDSNNDIRYVGILYRSFFQKNRIFKYQNIGGIDSLAKKLKKRNKTYINFAIKKEVIDRNTLKHRCNSPQLTKLLLNIKYPTKTYQYLDFYKCHSKYNFPISQECKNQLKKQESELQKTANLFLEFNAIQCKSQQAAQELLIIQKMIEIIKNRL